MESEKFCLRWNDFETSISRAFKELREEKDFFDVTLVCDDSQIDAHKVILSACSPFFRSILIRNPHQHPLLYLKGVKYSELLSVLNFMYMGEVNVAQEELNSFLSVAEELKVKGLTQGNSGPVSLNEKKVNHTKKELNQRDKNLKSHIQNPTRKQAYQNDDSYEIQEAIPVKTEPEEPSLTLPVYTAKYPTQQEHQAEPVLGQQTVVLADSYEADEVEAYDYQYEEGYVDMSAAGFEANSSSDADSALHAKMRKTIAETRMCSLSSTIVYRHMVSITPRLAIMFLVNHLEVDTDCSVSLEDVIKHFREKNRNVLVTCGRNFGQKFCKCEKCQQLKKLYIYQCEGEEETAV